MVCPRTLVRQKNFRTRAKSNWNKSRTCWTRFPLVKLQRAASRIRYLLDMPNYDPWLMEQDLRGVLTDPMDIKIMTQMVITTCQSEVAKSLGVTQGFVRHRYFRTIDRLKKMRGMEQYVHVFEHVAANLNILKETHRSKWAEPVIYVVAENPTGVSR
jgi:hypothetical protein